MPSSSSRVATAVPERRSRGATAIGRWMLALAATGGVALALTACATDARKLSCKDINGNPAAVDAMAKAAMTNPALAPYINPSNKFGGGGQDAASAGIDEGGLTNEFKNQVAGLCAGASGATQPYDTALGNTENFARTGARTPAPPAQSDGQQSSGSNSGSGSDQGSGATGGGSSSGAGSGGSGGSQPSQAAGPQPNGSSSSGGSSSGGGSSSSGSGGGASGSGSSGSGGSSSSGNGNANIPPCLPPSCAF